MNLAGISEWTFRSLSLLPSPESTERRIELLLLGGCVRGELGRRGVGVVDDSSERIRSRDGRRRCFRGVDDLVDVAVVAAAVGSTDEEVERGKVVDWGNDENTVESSKAVHDRASSSTVVDRVACWRIRIGEGGWRNERCAGSRMNNSS